MFNVVNTLRTKLVSLRFDDQNENANAVMRDDFISVAEKMSFRYKANDYDIKMTHILCKQTN